MIGTCQSCGRDGEELAEVRRVYVVPTTSGDPEVTETDDYESWCPACRSTYPHRALD